MTMKISAICAQESVLTEINAVCLNIQDVLLTTHLGSLSLLSDVLDKDKPHLLFLELPMTHNGEMDKVEEALHKNPGVHLVLVSPDRSVDFLMRAMRAGVREVLPTPLAVDSFKGSINHARSSQVIPSYHTGVGKVLGVIAAKGGGGATFLATNLAFALSRLGKRVVVLDLNLYFGDAAIFLGDSVSKTTIVDLARQSQELDMTMFESSMAKVSERLHLVVSPETPVNINVVSPVAIQKIIDLARSNYDFVVIDMCALLDSTAVKALDMCDTVNLVLQLNLPDIRAAKRMVRVFRDLGYDNDKINIMVNRYIKGGDITLHDVEKATMLKVSRVFPNSYVPVTASINQGIPLLELKPQDEVALALNSWAHELVPGSEPAKPPTQNWFQNLMGHVK